MHASLLGGSKSSVEVIERASKIARAFHALDITSFEGGKKFKTRWAILTILHD